MSRAKPVALLVIGMHRSGTSAVTRVLNLLGVDLGSRLIAAGEDNPLGFWENSDVVALHDRLLADFGMSWDDPQPLPAGWMDTDAAVAAKAEIRRIAEGEFGQSALWAVKDPRLSHFVPLWRSAIGSRVRLKAVIVSRRPDDVARSLARRNGLPDGVAQLLWTRYLADAEEGTRGMPRSLVQFESLLQNWASCVARIGAELDLPLRIDAANRAQVDAFLTGSLYHNHEAGPVEARDLVAPLFAALQGPSSSLALTRFADVRAAFDQRIEPFLPVVSGLSRMLADERGRLASANADNGLLSASLAESGAWGETRDAELRASLAALQALRLELEEATTWARSRDAELEKALAAASALQAQLSEATLWSESREKELQKVLAANLALGTQLAESTEWGASRDAELLKALAAGAALQVELAESTAWGKSRDAELLKALEASAALRAELAESTAWGASRHAELEQTLATHAALQATLAEATAWAESREAALLEALESNRSISDGLAASIEARQSLDQQLQQTRAGLEQTKADLAGARSLVTTREGEISATRQELTGARARVAETDALLVARNKELASLEVLLGSIRAERDRLDGNLRDSEQEMEALRELIERDLRNVREELQARAEESDRLRAASERELVRKQLELDGLQHQANLLNARLAMVEERLFRTGPMYALRRLAGSALRLLKGGSKAAVIGAARALPGSPERKQGRLQRLRSLNEARKTGANSKSILADVHQLAEGRWPARPAYLARVPSLEELPRIDISVVVYDSERWVDGFMASLLESDYPLDRISLLVRDHSAGDGTRLAFDRFFDQHPNPLAAYRYSAGRNAGFGAGHNHNFKQANSAHFLVCNVDGKFHAETLATLMRAVATSDSDVAAWELRQSPYEHPKYYDPVTLLTTWVSGACVLFRSEAYRKVGGFDDLIFMYGEDVDLSYRLRGRGYKLAYVPHALFRHDSYDEPAQFKSRQFHGSTLANILLRLRFGSLRDLLAIPDMWRELGTSAEQQGAYRGYLRNTAKLLLLGPLFLLTRYRRGSARIPFARWDYGLRRDGAFEPVTVPAQPQPLVSIVVRTYRGRGQLLRQALASIANQTYAAIEVIVVEDKGDDMREVAESAARDFGLDMRFMACLESDSNRCKTGNLGLAAARGDYLNFLDDDDLFFADHVEYLVARLAAQPGLGACYSLAWETKVVPDPVTGGYLEVMHSSLPGQRIAFNRELLKAMNYMPIQSVLFRRELFERYGGLNPSLDNLEDWNLWRRYSWRHDFQVSPKTTSLYHIPHDSSKLEARQSLLDYYYVEAKRESDAACELIDYREAGKDRRAVTQ